jgi:hypothetical protein
VTPVSEIVLRMKACRWSAVTGCGLKMTTFEVETEIGNSVKKKIKKFNT